MNFKSRKIVYMTPLQKKENSKYAQNIKNSLTTKISRVRIVYISNKNDILMGNNIFNYPKVCMLRKIMTLYTALQPC